jgi:hypothetical protein
MARKFSYVAARMLMLALSFHFGFTTATAQAPGNPVVAALHTSAVVTANGDVYLSSNGADGPLVLLSNVFSSGPVPAQRATWGQGKARYAPTPETAQPQTNDR